MKKYFLLVVLMMVVFLWWGTSLALASCEDKNISTSSYYNYLWSSGGVAHKFTCEDDSSRNTVCPDGSQTCVWNWTNCTASWKSCCICNQPLTYMQPKSITEPSGDIAPAIASSLLCTRSWSILYWDYNAEDVAVGLLCKCKTGYGEYYDPDLNKTTCQPCSLKKVCCGVKLNTNVPFIGNCLEQDTSDPSAVSPERAFPVLMSSLTKILVTVILIVSFVLIVVGGIMIASAWPNQSKASEGRKLIMKVVVGIALLGASGVILRLINPNFFG